MATRITGINHVTLAVKDLDAAIDFYVDLLGFRLVARWSAGAYLAAGTCWLALARTPSASAPAEGDESHIAFSVAAGDIADAVRRLDASGVRTWRENRSEGPSHYFVGPDGHRLELHVGDLDSRLAHLRSEDRSDVVIYSGPMSGPDPTPHQEFSGEILRQDAMAEDPLVVVGEWLAEAARAGEPDPFAMTLSTVAEDGAPSSRTVALKEATADGFVFASPTSGPKARELASDDRASIVMYWPVMSRQVRASGRVARLDDGHSARYFYARPRQAQLALHAATQSEPIASREKLEDRVAALDARFADGVVPVPDWAAYVLVPAIVEFWQGHSDRLHDRFRYERDGRAGWKVRRLAP